MRRILPIVIVCMTAAFTGCTVGPNYKRPAVPAPPQFRAGSYPFQDLGVFCQRRRGSLLDRQDETAAVPQVGLVRTWTDLARR